MRYLIVLLVLMACRSNPTAPRTSNQHDPCGIGSPDPFCSCASGQQRAQIGNYSDGTPMWACITSP